MAHTLQVYRNVIVASLKKVDRIKQGSAMSRFSFLHALIVAVLLVGAGVALNAGTPTAAMACSDPPCRAR
jgi:putative copper export protein